MTTASLQAGFAKVDITPRVGVELCGFGPFLNRHSIGVRDRLWARAMALRQEESTLVLVSCDLGGLAAETTGVIRDLVGRATGLSRAEVMVHCTHTHSGPTTFGIYGWGAMDHPYVEILPGRIAQAAVAAVGQLAPAVLSHAAVPCEGIGLNREYDRDAPPLAEVLRDDWRPAKPELTDTVCHVLQATAADSGRRLGFCSYFGCHPVVCCQETRYIHGDFVGVATNLLERENPGAVGLFLQGAQGDVNSCVVHKPEPEALLALDVIAARYANCVRHGLAEAKPIAVDALRAVSRPVTFSRAVPTREEILKLLAENEAILQAPGTSDADPAVRLASVYVQSMRSWLVRLAEKRDLNPPSEVHGFRLGPVALLGSEFEVFQAIKNDVVRAAAAPVPLVLGITNGLLGYAPDRTAAARGGYAARQVPLMLGILPLTDIHTELRAALLELDGALAGN